MSGPHPKDPGFAAVAWGYLPSRKPYDTTTEPVSRGGPGKSCHGLALRLGPRSAAASKQSARSDLSSASQLLLLKGFSNPPLQKSHIWSRPSARTGISRPCANAPRHRGRPSAASTGHTREEEQRQRAPPPLRRRHRPRLPQRPRRRRRPAPSPIRNRGASPNTRASCTTPFGLALQARHRAALARRRVAPKPALKRRVSRNRRAPPRCGGWKCWRACQPPEG